MNTPTIVFAEGAFDDFDGTQEELDDLVKQIIMMCQSGEIFEIMEEVDEDEMSELLNRQTHLH